MQVFLQKDKDGKVSEGFEHNNKAPGLLRVFISDHRPNGEERPGMKDIAADFAWRRSVKMTDVKKDATFKKVIAEFVQKPESDLLYRFNRHCGCAMCPCSPGILIQDKTQHYQPANVKEVWVDIFNDDQNPDVILAEEEAKRAEARAAAAAKKVAEDAAKIAEVAIATPVPEVSAEPTPAIDDGQPAIEEFLAETPKAEEVI
jgi:hypothetical protein